MGLEIATYVSGLTASWPTSGEPKSQGDDHLRLLKSVLQATFPNATKPYYLPTANALTGNTTLTSVSQNSIVFCSTASAAFTVALPTLDSTQGGWSVEIVKYSTDANYVAVVPPSGNIFTQFGAVASVCVGVANTPAKFVWSGGAWYSFKLGPMVGETTNWHGPTIPAGYLPLSGYSYTGSFNPGIYTELYLALGSVATLYDVRGRIEAGLDPGVSRLTTNTMPGGGHVMGSAAGAELHTLTIAQMPGHAHTASSTSAGSHSHTGGFSGTGTIGSGVLAWAQWSYGNTPGPSTGADGAHTHPITVDANGGGVWHPIIQPTIIVQKLIRAC